MFRDEKMSVVKCASLWREDEIDSDGRGSSKCSIFL